MKIYTRTGDEGYTGRPGGQRLRKSDARLSAQGDLDELNSHLGLCACQARATARQSVIEMLGQIQGDLMTLGCQLAASGCEKPAPVTLKADRVAWLETCIDECWRQCSPLEHFVIPGGCELACRLHVARTVCRRTERSLVASVEREPRIPPVLFQYVNRLGDLLFAMARLANKEDGETEVQWPNA